MMPDDALKTTLRRILYRLHLESEYIPVTLNELFKIYTKQQQELIKQFTVSMYGDQE